MARTKTIPVIQMMVIDFDRLSLQSEQEILNRFLFYCRTTKGMFKKAIRYNGFQVFKQTEDLIINIMFDQDRTAQFSFIPPPDFSRMPVTT